MSKGTKDSIFKQSGVSGLRGDEVLEAQLGSIENRVNAVGWVVACFFPALFLALGVSQRGYIRFASWVFFVFLAVQFSFRLLRERSIIRNRRTAVATVVAESQKPLEAGWVGSVRYRFSTDDGRIYTGKSGWIGRSLPHVGQTVPVLYKQSDPCINLALLDFRFYAFDFDGANRGSLGLG
jgi:hypothetical protein